MVYDRTNVFPTLSRWRKNNVLITFIFPYIVFLYYLIGYILCVEPRLPGIDRTVYSWCGHHTYSIHSYSTTISSTGITAFYSLATTSQKMIHGWDAICGYLQTKEQFDIYAYLPTHEGYSSLEYEDLGEMRKNFSQDIQRAGYGWHQKIFQEPQEAV